MPLWTMDWRRNLIFYLFHHHFAWRNDAIHNFLLDRLAYACEVESTTLLQLQSASIACDSLVVDVPSDAEMHRGGWTMAGLLAQRGARWLTFLACSHRLANSLDTRHRV